MLNFIKLIIFKKIYKMLCAIDYNTEIPDMTMFK